MDWLGEIAAVDIKTTKDASPAGFAKAVANYRYHVQQAHYLAGCAALGLPASDFVFVAVEKAEPYPVACYQLSDAAEGVGYRLWRRDLTAFATCQKGGPMAGIFRRDRDFKSARLGVERGIRK
ncbi:MAG: PD-(D/E)XK nuclease-like domain-containing protein [Candidatus Competibacteraceae bacterium]|nr:PD-(D/E)XK nuclease-like domain-containing protein [Candidatus Competibacteraceae bacterium]